MLCSFLPAVNNLTNECLEAEKTNRQLDRELKALRKNIGTTLVLHSSLQEYVWFSEIKSLFSHFVAFALIFLIPPYLYF